MVKEILNQMKVAIIDDGVDDRELTALVRHVSFVPEHAHSGSTVTHGTICAKIIEKYGNVSDLYDLKTIPSVGDGNLSYLIEALNYCLNVHVDIINISNGSYNYIESDHQYRLLKDVCRKLARAGTIIFAAESNIGRLTIPSAFASVISVEQKNPLRNSRASLYRQSNLYVNGAHIIKIGGKIHFTKRCNSFACAYACALATKNTSGNGRITFPKEVLINTNVVYDGLYRLHGRRKSLNFNSLLFLFEGKRNSVPVISVSPQGVPYSSGVALQLKDLAMQSGYYAMILSDQNIKLPRHFKSMNETFILKSIHAIWKSSHCDLILYDSVSPKSHSISSMSLTNMNIADTCLTGNDFADTRLTGMDIAGMALTDMDIHYLEGHKFSVMKDRSRRTCLSIEDVFNSIRENFEESG